MQRRDGRQHRQQRRVGAPLAQLTLPPAGRGHVLQHLRRAGLDAVGDARGGEQGEQVAADRVAGGVPVQAFGAGVPAHDHAVGVAGDDRVGDRVQQVPLPAGVLEQLEGRGERVGVLDHPARDGGRRLDERAVGERDRAAAGTQHAERADDRATDQDRHDEGIGRRLGAGPVQGRDDGVEQRTGQGRLGASRDGPHHRDGAGGTGERARDAAVRELRADGGDQTLQQMAVVGGASNRRTQTSATARRRDTCSYRPVGPRLK